MVSRLGAVLAAGAVAGYAYIASRSASGGSGGNGGMTDVMDAPSSVDGDTGVSAPDVTQTGTSSGTTFEATTPDSGAATSDAVDTQPSYTQDVLSGDQAGVTEVTSLQVSDDQVGVGDPVTVTYTVEGQRGRVNVPVPLNVSGGLIDDIRNMLSFRSDTTETVTQTIVPASSGPVTLRAGDLTETIQVT